MEFLTGYSDDEETENSKAAVKPAGKAKAKVKAAPKSTGKALPKSTGKGHSWVAPRSILVGAPDSDLSLALPSVNAAPHVDLLGQNVVSNFAISPSDKMILTNPTFAAMNKPLAGPTKAGAPKLEEQFYNHKLGHVEKASMNEFTFDMQYHTFHNFGYSANPARDTRGQDQLISRELKQRQVGKTIYDKAPSVAQAAKRRKLEGVPAEGEDGEAEEFEFEDDEARAKWGGFVDESVVRQKIEEEVRLREEEVARQAEEERAVLGEEAETKERVTSIFHGAKETDYKGRSWIEAKGEPAKDLDEKQCYLPKKWVHTWSGHTMGVQQIRWFPNSAHLILSAGMDAKIKIWDYHNQRKCLRTYQGHDQAVRDINFTTDGRKFYSVSYDKNIQYWDTETGQVISTFTNKKTNFCVSVHPDPSKQNVIICGCSSKKAVQWDANSASIVQEYDDHMGAVNTVTFCEEGKRILTTSDDKKIFVWEFGIPVVVKHIAEPTMHSVPAVTLCPKKKFLIGQSMDNKIITYEAFGRFKFQGKRQFKGHLNAGYAISPGFSADGKWVMSGDIEGKLWFWDFQKMKNYRVIKAHDGVLMSCMWHPTQTSRVVTCGWDGQIKLWD